MLLSSSFVYLLCLFVFNLAFVIWIFVFLLYLDLGQIIVDYSFPLGGRRQYFAEPRKSRLLLI